MEATAQFVTDMAAAGYTQQQAEYLIQNDLLSLEDGQQVLRFAAQNQPRAAVLAWVEKRGYGADTLAKVRAAYDELRAGIVENNTVPYLPDVYTAANYAAKTAQASSNVFTKYILPALGILAPVAVSIFASKNNNTDYTQNNPYLSQQNGYPVPYQAPTGTGNTTLILFGVGAALLVLLTRKQ